MRIGALAACLALAPAPALALAGCESSQTKSARLARLAKAAKPQTALHIARRNPAVRVVSATLVSDSKAGSAAAVIVVRNRSPRAQSALPILFTVRDARARKLFANDAAGSSADLTTIASIGPRAELAWVDDQVPIVAGARAVSAEVGLPAAAPPGVRLPLLTVSRMRLERDPSGPITGSARVVNRSAVTQRGLVVFAVARRRGRVVAAGRAVLPLVKPGKGGARFTLFFVGDPRGARLSVRAPPVTVR